MESLRGRVAELEDELKTIRGKPVTVVVEKPKVKALPESQASIDKRQRKLDRSMRNDQADQEAEHDRDFHRMMNLEPGDEGFDGVWR